MCSISPGSTLSLGAWIRQLRLLDADQQDLRVRDTSPPGRCTAGSSRPGPRSSSGAPYASPIAARIAAYAGPSSEPTNGSPTATRSISHLHAPRRARAQVRDERVLRGLAVHPRRDAQADARAPRRPAPPASSRPPAGSRCRARSPPGAPRAGPRPCRRPSARRRRARWRPCGTARRVVDAVPRLRRRRARRPWCRRARRAARRASGSARPARPARRRRTARSASRCQRVRRCTSTLVMPAQRRGQGRQADREVAGVADDDRVGAQQVGVLGHERLEPAGALLLGALADHLDGDRDAPSPPAARAAP